MTEKKRAWQAPQNWVIALLLLGIAGYFAIHYLHKPKVNRLQQATAYFDALEAEERAEREHQAALQAQQQATAERLAATTAKAAAQQAQQAAAQARQQAEEANRQVAQAQHLARSLVDHPDENQSIGGGGEGACGDFPDHLFFYQADILAADGLPQGCV